MKEKKSWFELWGSHGLRDIKYLNCLDLLKLECRMLKLRGPSPTSGSQLRFRGASKTFPPSFFTKNVYTWHISLQPNNSLNSHSSILRSGTQKKNCLTGAGHSSTSPRPGGAWLASFSTGELLLSDRSSSLSSQGTGIGWEVELCVTHFLMRL